MIHYEGEMQSTFSRGESGTCPGYPFPDRIPVRSALHSQDDGAIGRQQW